MYPWHHRTALKVLFGNTSPWALSTAVELLVSRCQLLAGYPSAPNLAPTSTITTARHMIFVSMDQQNNNPPAVAIVTGRWMAGGESVLGEDHVARGFLGVWSG